MLEKGLKQVDVINRSKHLQEELGIKLVQVQNVIKLLDEGNTIPFIARYRKELTE